MCYFKKNTTTNQDNSLCIPADAPNYIRTKTKRKCLTCNITTKQLWRCKGCRKVLYCSVACQKTDWVKHHWEICKLIKM